MPICYHNESASLVDYQRLANEASAFVGSYGNFDRGSYLVELGNPGSIDDPVLVNTIIANAGGKVKVGTRFHLADIRLWGVEQDGYYPARGTVTCYDFQSLKSGLFISKLRYQSHLDHGDALNADERWIWLLHDIAISRKQFIQDDQDVANNQVPPTIIYKTLDGYHAFSDADIQEYNLQKQIVELKKLEEAAIGRLPGGTTAAQALAISKTMATDPLGRLVAGDIASSAYLSLTGTSQGSVMDELAHRSAASSPLVNQARFAIDPSIRARIDLPVGVDNVLSQQDELLRQSRLASTIAAQSPVNYRRTQISEEAQRITASNYDYWQNNYPKVELLPDDNQNVDPKLLTLPYVRTNCLSFVHGSTTVFGHISTVGNRVAYGTPCQSPPLVNMRITPRIKPKPKLGFFGSVPWLAKIAGIIPFVGWILSTAISSASTSQQKHFARSWQIPSDAFSPQYEPKAFWVILPLDKAQVAIKQPWYLPAMYADFEAKIKSEAMNVMGFGS